MKKSLILSAISFFPAISFAACGSTKNFTWAACIVAERVLTPLIGIVVALAMLYFLWGLTKYLTKTGDEKTREEAKHVMIFSLLAMFVMFSVWGLVRVLMNTFDITGSETVPIPNINVR